MIPVWLDDRTLHLPNAGVSHAFGAMLAAHLAPGTLLLLRGPLGAGKTTVVQGLAQGLGVHAPQEVRSASFALLEVHDGPSPLVHVDLYRLEAAAEADILDLPAWLAQGAIVAVEWPENAPELARMPHEYVVLCDVEHGAARTAQLSVALAAALHGSPASG